MKSDFYERKRREEAFAVGASSGQICVAAIATAPACSPAPWHQIELLKKGGGLSYSLLQMCSGDFMSPRSG
jgi:hypothetical protein